MPTIGQQLQRSHGVGMGFDACRLGLSMTILCWHSVVTSYGQLAEAAVWRDPMSAPLTALLPVFFALSGFLVMGSFVRAKSLGHFLGLRALRIVPALLTEILISALLLGALLTSHSLASYFTDPLFFKYFGSLIGKVSNVLPGMFETNPDPGRVNLSLWTIAPELSCYVYLALQLALRLGRVGTTVAAGLLIAANLAADVANGLVIDPGAVASRLLVVSFAFGNLLYVWRDVVPFRRSLFVASLALGLGFIRAPILDYCALASLAYVIVYLSCCRIRVPRPFSTGDYSYGIYLYAYPIQQMYTAFFPGHREFYWNIAFCLPVTCCAAALSWWLVERPALGAKRILQRLGPSPATPTLAGVLAPVLLLSIYGVMLSISSGFIPTAQAVPALALALLGGGVVTITRWLHLRGGVSPDFGGRQA